MNKLKIIEILVGLALVQDMGKDLPRGVTSAGVHPILIDPQASWKYRVSIHSPGAEVLASGKWYLFREFVLEPEFDAVREVAGAFVFVSDPETGEAWMCDLDT